MILDLQIAQDDWLDRHSKYSVSCMPCLPPRLWQTKTFPIFQRMYGKDIFYIEFKFTANSELL